MESKVKQGDKIKILLVNPNCVASEMVANRSYARANINRTRNQINVSLQFVHELHKLAPENVEIRTTEHPIAMGVIGIDPHWASGKLYMEYFAFKTNGLPYFVLSVKDRKWYNLFKEEMLLLWENATEWKWE